MTAEKFSIDQEHQTTSAEWHEARAEERKEMGVYFGDRVKTKTGQKPQDRVKTTDAPTLSPYPSTLQVSRQGHEPTDNKPTKHRSSRIWRSPKTR